MELQLPLFNCNSLVPLLWRRELSSPFANKEVWFYLSVALLRIDLLVVLDFI